MRHVRMFWEGQLIFKHCGAVGCGAHRIVEGMQKLTAHIFFISRHLRNSFFFQSVELSSRPTALACAFPLHCAADKKEKDTECLNETVLKVQ